MTIRVLWHNEQKTIIRHSYEKGWGWQDFHKALDETLKMSADNDQAIDLFLDLHDAQTIPAGAITHFRQLTQKLSPKVAFVVVTGGNQFMKTMFTMFQRVGGHWADNYVWASTFDEACSIVSERQNSLACQLPAQDEAESVTM